MKSPNLQLHATYYGGAYNDTASTWLQRRQNEDAGVRGAQRNTARLLLSPRASPAATGPARLYLHLVPLLQHCLAYLRTMPGGNQLLGRATTTEESWATFIGSGPR